MSIYDEHVSSTRAGVKNVQAVVSILARYYWEQDEQLGYDIQLHAAETGSAGERTSGDPEQLGARGEITISGGGWPQAVRTEQLPDEQDFQDASGNLDDSAYHEALWKVYLEKGEEGFLSLLLELAPHLESPLRVVAAGWDSADKFSVAKEWVIRPGATEVETKEIECQEWN